MVSCRVAFRRQRLVLGFACRQFQSRLCTAWRDVRVRLWNQRTRDDATRQCHFRADIDPASAHHLYTGNAVNSDYSNPSKQHRNGPLYSNTVIRALAVDGYSDEGTGRGRSPPAPGHSFALYQCTVLLYIYNGPLLYGFNVPIKALTLTNRFQLQLNHTAATVSATRHQNVRLHCTI